MADAARKQRIIDHLNADHQAELTVYLRHFLSLPADLASSDPRVVDISAEGLSIVVASSSSSSKIHHVAFDPPLSSLAESRPRLVAMSEQGRAALGLPGPHEDKQTNNNNMPAARGHQQQQQQQQRLTRFAWPRGVENAPFFGVILYFVCHTALVAGLLDAGTPAGAVLDAGWPLGGRQGFAWLVSAIYWPVFGIHLFEAWWFDRTRLRTHGVPRGSALWWKWCLCCFFEGFTCFNRFGDVIKQDSAAATAKAGKSH